MGSGEEVEKVKSLHGDRQTDRQTGDQKISLKHSAQVSLKRFL